MKNFITKPLVVVLFCFVFVGGPGMAVFAAEPNQEVLAADKILVAALAKGDQGTVDKALDQDFLWITSQGEILSRADALKTLPKPLIGDENGTQVIERTYGEISVVHVASGQVHISRVWGKRPAGWRLLIYHTLIQRETPAGPSGLPSTNICDNPCKGIPYTAKNDAEKGIMAWWADFATGVTNHDAAAVDRLIGDEFVLYAGGLQPTSRQARLAALKQPGIGPALAGILLDPPSRFVHFGDSVSLVANRKPYAGKPNVFSGVFVKQDGKWKLMYAYETTNQSAAPYMPQK